MLRVQFVLLFIFIVFSEIFSQSINDLISQEDAYFIQSAQEYGKSDKGYWDIPGGEENIRENAQIKVWQLADAQRDRRYKIRNSTTPGYVKIHVQDVGGFLDVKGASNDNGTILTIQNNSEAWNQNYNFKYMGKGRFKIFSQNGKIVCLSGQSSENGTALNMWDDHEGPWTEWVLLSTITNEPIKLESQINKIVKSKGQSMDGLKSVYIQSAMTYGRYDKGYFDVQSQSDPISGNNIQSLSLDLGNDRKFNITPSTSAIGYYNVSVAGNNNLLLDVSGGVDANGTNIDLWERNNTISQNFIFKDLGYGKYKIIAQNGKVVCLANNSAENGSNIIIWDDQEGAWMEWYLIDAATNKPFFSDSDLDINSLEIENLQNIDFRNMFRDVDDAFNRISTWEDQSYNLLCKLKNIYGTITTSNNLINNVGSLTQKVNDTESALSPFSRLPFIGIPVNAVQSGLNLSLSQLNRANTALQLMKGNVIDQTNANVSYSLIKNIVLNSQLNKIKGRLFNLKKLIGSLAIQENYSPTRINFVQIKERFTEQLTAINSIEINMTEIEKTCSSIEKLNVPINAFDNGLNTFNNGFNKVDKVADQINNVLEKRFTKKIGNVGIDVSVRDIIEGGKVGKLFDKYASEYVDKIFETVLNKLNVPIPSVPNVDKFKDALTEGLDFTKKIRINSEAIEKVTTAIADRQAELEKKSN